MAELGKEDMHTETQGMDMIPHSPGWRMRPREAPRPVVSNLVAH